MKTTDGVEMVCGNCQLWVPDEDKGASPLADQKFQGKVDGLVLAVLDGEASMSAAVIAIGFIQTKGLGHRGCEGSFRSASFDAQPCMYQRFGIFSPTEKAIQEVNIPVPGEKAPSPD